MKSRFLVLVTLFCSISLFAQKANYSVGNIWDDGSVRYYLYNQSTGMYLGDDNQLHENAGDAALWTVTRKSNGKFAIKSGRNRYINLSTRIGTIFNASSSQTSASTEVDGVTYNGSYYTIGTSLYTMSSFSTRTHFLQANGTSINGTDNNTVTDAAKWTFVSENLYDMEIQRKLRVAELDLDGTMQETLDVTDYLTNPHVEMQTYGDREHLPEGWTAAKYVRGNANFTKVGRGNTFLEAWGQSSTMDIDYSQIISLPAGKYRISAQLFYTGNDNSLMLYASEIVGATEVPLGQPTYVAGQSSQDDNLTDMSESVTRYSLEFVVPNKGTSLNVKLGVRKDANSDESGDAWLGADNFKLEYLGIMSGPLDYWTGEELDASKPYYLCNVANGMYVGYDRDYSVVLEDAKLYSFLWGNHNGFNGGYVPYEGYNIYSETYELLVSYATFTGGFSAAVHNPKGDYTFWGDRNIRVSFTAERNVSDQSYSFRTVGYTLNLEGHDDGNPNVYFGVSGIGYSDIYPNSDASHWLLISEEQHDKYNTYLDLYDQAHTLYFDNLPMPQEYRDELERCLTTRAKYDPASHNDNVSPSLEKIIDTIKKLRGFVDHRENVPNGSYGTVCECFNFTSEGVSNIYLINGIDDKNELNLVEVDPLNLEPGVPYLYLANADVQNFKYNQGSLKQYPVNNKIVRSLSESGDPIEKENFLKGLFGNEYFKGMFLQGQTYSDMDDNLQVPPMSYVLQTKNGVQKFYRTTSGGKGKANHCYLQLPAEVDVAGINVYSFGTGEMVDALNELLDASKEKVIYDIQGRRHNTLQKGVNIVNGHKVIVR